MEEDVICTSMLYFIIYGGKITTVSLKDFMTLTVLTGYVPKCTIIGPQTWVTYEKVFGK